MKGFIYISFMVLFFLFAIDLRAESKSTLIKAGIQQDSTNRQQDSTKIKIRAEELPQAVKETLSGEVYRGWVVTEAYFVKEETEYYQIVLRKGSQMQTVNLDKDGNKVKSV